MLHTRTTHRAMGAALLGAFTLTACSDEPSAPRLRRIDSEVRIEASSSVAPIGGTFAVALRVDAGGAPVGAVQGRMRFDAGAVRYVGQGTENFVFVNAAGARDGELRLVGAEPDGMGDRPVVLVFEVLRPGYLPSFRYVSEELVLADSRLVDDVTVKAGATVAADLVMPDDVQLLGVDEWAARIADRADGDRFVDIDLRPGEYRLDLIYGDANLSGSLTSSDALVVAQVVTGQREIILNTQGGPDLVVAANVAPANSPGLGEPGDAIPPGLNADGSRSITGSDVLSIRRAIVGTPDPIVRALIPGRGARPTTRIPVSGNITTNTTWTKGNIYELQDIVRVTGGATLTIQAGTRVEGLTTAAGTVALYVLRDGRIDAQGTAFEPIVLTCIDPAAGGNKARGCWGGLWIAGSAPVNEARPAGAVSPQILEADGTTVRAAGGCLQRDDEADQTIKFGGCNASDNSGTLRYVIIEYAGKIVGTNNELNGLSLGGVGSGTTIENVQIHAGLDDGIEFFGGTVNVKRLVLTANSDDDFDFSFGYSGKAQFVIAHKDSLDGDKGIEADNTETSASYGNTPRTAPLLYNFTFVGAADPNSPSGAVIGTSPNNVNDALHFRRGTGPSLHNAIIVGFPAGVDIDDDATCAALDAPGGLNATNITFGNLGTQGIGNNDIDPACPGFTTAGEGEQDWLTVAGKNNVVLSAADAGQIFKSFGAGLSAVYEGQVPDWRPRAGGLGSITVVAPLPAGDTFFEAAPYRGAVAPANTAGSNIPWYSGWTRGWQTPTVP